MARKAQRVDVGNLTGGSRENRNLVAVEAGRDSDFVYRAVSRENSILLREERFADG